MSMRNREFGVELEFDSNGLGETGVGDLLWANGFREEWVGKRHESSNYYGEEYISYNGIGHDGTEIELRSPILKGKKGFDDLYKVVKLLDSAGCYTTEEDGLHVHHNAPEFVDNKELVIKLLRSWKHNEHNIAKFIDAQRAEWSLNDYDSPCPTFSYDAIEAYENLYGNMLPGYPYAFHRNNININALTEHGSIEFRWHEGTLHWPEIESWIRFGQSFLNGVINRKTPIMPAESPVILLNRLKTNDRARKFLTSKAGVVA